MHQNRIEDPTSGQRRSAEVGAKHPENRQASCLQAIIAALCGTGYGPAYCSNATLRMLKVAFGFRSMLIVGFPPSDNVSTMISPSRYVPDPEFPPSDNAAWFVFKPLL